MLFSVLHNETQHKLNTMAYKLTHTLTFGSVKSPTSPCGLVAYAWSFHPTTLMEIAVYPSSDWPPIVLVEVINRNTE